MDAMELLLNRASIAPRLHQEPAPSDAELRQIIAAACRAPDHGRLRPWRFIVIRGAARTRLGEVFAEALKQRRPDATGALIETELARPLRSPLLVAVVARVQKDHPKIPEIEQILSAGAAAHGMLLAAQAMGYGAMMLTGDNAYDPNVGRALGLAADDRIIAFVYLGTQVGEPPNLPRADPADHTSEWTAPSST